jgi:hypothetical protein
MSSSSNRRRLYWACLVVIGLLYLISVPWYRDPAEPLTLWLGLPDWVTVAVLCYVGVAIVNAVAWYLTDVPDDVVDLQSSDGLATSRSSSASSAPSPSSALSGTAGTKGTEASR